MSKLSHGGDADTIVTFVKSRGLPGTVVACVGVVAVDILGVPEFPVDFFTLYKLTFGSA